MFSTFNNKVFLIILQYISDFVLVVPTYSERCRIQSVMLYFIIEFLLCLFFCLKTNSFLWLANHTTRYLAIVETRANCRFCQLYNNGSMREARCVSHLVHWAVVHWAAISLITVPTGGAYAHSASADRHRRTAHDMLSSISRYNVSLAYDIRPN